VTRVADRLHAHAAGLVARELRRRGAALSELDPERRALVEAVAVRVVAEVADGVLEHARGDGVLASALASIYDADGAGRSGTLVESALGAAH
jgi:hypothetical protein